MLTNPVLLSVLVMAVLCLLRVNVLIALILSALLGGVLSGMSVGDSIAILINGMGGSAETALSYILLGALAVAIGKTGVADILARKIGRVIDGRRRLFVLLIAGVACFSQNLIPVHIAFIPILIPPLIPVMNKYKIDRRGVASALTFGLKAPYIILPVGFGLLFHNIIRDALIDNGVFVETNMIWKSMLLPGIGMIVGLFIAVLISYKKPREYKELELQESDTKDIEELGVTREHWAALVGAVAAFVIQIITKSLPLGAIVGLALMMMLGGFKWKELDEMINGGIGLMGFIAFVMLVASGYGAVIRETGGVESLVKAAAGMMGGSKAIAAFTMLLIGLIITLGIGTSFGTVPIIATIFVPLCIALGFSPAATICLVGTAGALGDAGSPASDSTLGPTAGLNVDGQHDHIWDTCVPTFLHYNIPLLIFGTIAAVLL
ncbi:Na+/H+ antiporter family protein [Tissierella pigra]|uniref:Na+/H+ antiporter family protein n=1 Tax=Tissierella pigra TaxID=2607614 RepID=A0A6N7XLU3_9FIRM|nr:Na+/H+ antiporter family protein [Tissierella pigra]MBU5427349.1 Na+/H+ antiporter family protein [Tissierella pigra]MSU03061.1 Na+/H+ antiporter family protein [Tissierella pigra]